MRFPFYKNLSSNESSNYFSVIGVWVAALALVTGVIQFWINSEHQKESMNFQYENTVLQMYGEALETEIRLYSLKDGQDKEQNLLRNKYLFITETIFQYTKTDKAWQATVDFRLKENKKWLEEIDFVCNTFSKDFVKKLKEVLNKSKICTSQ